MQVHMCKFRPRRRRPIVTDVRPQLL